MLKVIIAGSRDFTNYKLLQEWADTYLQRHPVDQIEIISGGARGTDRLGERYAKERGIALKIMPADWKTYGESAGYRRNAEMAEYATHAIIFWDKQSSGTKHMIDLAKKYELTLRIVHIEKESLIKGMR
jgi:hypothetical protein